MYKIFFFSVLFTKPNIDQESLPKVLPVPELWSKDFSNSQKRSTTKIEGVLNFGLGR